MAEKTRLAISIDVTGIPQLTKLKAALTNASASSKVLGQQFGRTRNELKLLERSIKPSVNSTRALRDSFRELANQVAFGSKQFSQATREAERLDKQLAKMEKRKAGRIGGFRGAAQIAGTVAAGGVFGGPEGSAGALLGAAVGGPAGAAVGAAIGAQVGQLRQAISATAEYAAQLSKLRIALEGVTANGVEFNEAVEFITQSTKDFAIPQSVLTQQFTKLQASVQGSGGSLEDTQIAFKGIVAAVRATGGSLQDVDSALTATAQVFSKGKVSAEELRQQIGERLPGAFTLFASSMDKTPRELDKALEKGEVTLDDFLKFAEELFKKYGDTAQEIADGPDAAGDRLKVSLEELNEQVGKLLKPIGAQFQSFSTFVVEQLTTVIEKINQLAEGGGKAMALQNYNVQLRNVLAAEEKLLKAQEGGASDELLSLFEQKVQQQTDRLQILRDALNQEVYGDYKPRGRGRKPGDGGDDDVDILTGASDISVRLLNAVAAAIRETNEKRKIALELEAELIRIEESRKGVNQKQLDIIIASDRAKRQMAKLDKEEDERKKKVLEETQKMLDSFMLGNQTQFDLNAQEAPMTPFDMLRQGADEFTDSLKGALEASKQLAQVGLQGISNAITELVVNGTLNFREFAASLLRDMANIIMQQIVVKSLMQAIGFGTSLDPSSFLLSNPTTFNASQVTADLTGFVPKMAKGGITNGISIAGEAGPEAVVPLPDGRSIPVTMQGAGTSVVVNVDAQGTAVQGDSGRANELGQALGSAIRQELLKQKRPGGLLA